jgi:hypothetical protein
MLHRFHHRFGTAGVVIAVIALVAALGGTAIAASGALTGKQKKEVEKIAKKFAGKPGANGTNGSTGAPGAKGDAGSAGATGPAGKNVVLGSSAPTCAEGGASVEVEGAPAGKKEVCNGVEGPPGPAGPSCNASGECLLPPGATETGVWQFQKQDPLSSYVVSVSFPLRLTEAPDIIVVSPANSGTPGAVTGCPGTAAEPDAAAGNFCFYESENSGVEETVVPGSGSPDLTSGVSIRLVAAEPTLPETARGSWAVTR